MSAIKIKIKVHGTNGPWFDAEIEVSPVHNSNGIPIVKTDVVVFKTPVTVAIFGGYKNGQVFTYETSNGDVADVYFVGETDEVFAFSSLPNLP